MLHSLFFFKFQKFKVKEPKPKFVINNPLASGFCRIAQMLLGSISVIVVRFGFQIPSEFPSAIIFNAILEQLVLRHGPHSTVSKIQKELNKIRNFYIYFDKLSIER